MGSSAPRHRRRAQDGYTLVELVVAMGLSAMVGVMLFAVLMFSISFMRRGASELDTEQLTRIALAHLVRELREAHADAVMVWPEVAGEPFQAVGFVSPRQDAPGRPFSLDSYGRPARQTAIYYVHDAPSGVLWRIARPWDGTFTVPPTSEGRVMVRGVKGMTINRQEDLVTITLIVRVGRQDRRLATAVQVRN